MASRLPAQAREAPDTEQANDHAAGHNLLVFIISLPSPQEQVCDVHEHAALHPIFDIMPRMSGDFRQINEFGRLLFAVIQPAWF